MTRDEKIKAIEDMEINIKMQCPDDHYEIEIKKCTREDGIRRTIKEAKTICQDCWIKALEDKPC